MHPDILNVQIQFKSRCIVSRKILKLIQLQIGKCILYNQMLKPEFNIKWCQQVLPAPSVQYMGIEFVCFLNLNFSSTESLRTPRLKYCI